MKLQEYFDIHEKIFNAGYTRTISNLKLKINQDKNLNLTKNNFYLDFKNNLQKINSFELFKDYVSKNNKCTEYLKILDDLLEVKICLIKNENITIGIINSKHLDLSKMKKIKFKNISVEFDILNKNKKIYHYLSKYSNPYLNNNKKKNMKIKQLLGDWRLMEKNNIKEYSIKKDKNLTLNIIKTESCTKKININKILLNNEQISLTGRTHLPETISFSFICKSRITIKDNYIRFLPSKHPDETFEMFKEKIYYLLTFSLNFLTNFFPDTNLLDYLKDINNDLFDVKFNSNLYIKLEENYILFPIQSKFKIKNLSSGFIIYNFTCNDNLEELIELITLKKKEYSNITEFLIKTPLLELFNHDSKILKKMFEDVIENKDQNPKELLDDAQRTRQSDL